MTCATPTFYETIGNKGNGGKEETVKEARKHETWVFAKYRKEERNEIEKYQGREIEA